jgi:hypothetical protein
MAKSKFKNCFISAPAGTDTAALRAALEQRNVQWRDQTNIALGTNLLVLLDEEMSRADFVCAVVPYGQYAAVLFELGIAAGKNKPILAFVESPVGLPLDALTYFVLTPDSETLGRAIDVFLSHSKPNPKRARKETPVRSQTSGIRPSPTNVGVDAERRTAELFRQAGYIVSDETSPTDRGVDLAVWIDELESAIGGPLLVQVKSGDPTLTGLRHAEEQLRQYVLKTNGRFGLLVWWNGWDVEQPRMRPDRAAWPVILTLSGERLIALVQSGELTSELTRLRNAAVHGRV